MSATHWKWLKEPSLHAHYDANRLTGYCIQPPKTVDDLGPLSTKFVLFYPGGDAAVAYDSLEQAKKAAEDLYRSQAKMELPPLPPWAEP